MQLTDGGGEEGGALPACCSSSVFRLLVRESADNTTLRPDQLTRQALQPDEREIVADASLRSMSAGGKVRLRLNRPSSRPPILAAVYSPGTPTVVYLPKQWVDLKMYAGRHKSIRGAWKS